MAGALGPEFRGPGYDQDNWVRLHGYNELPWSTLVEFWYRYNWFLIHIVSRITNEQLQSRCTIGSGGPQTLRFIVEDYILHMQHHLDHILRRGDITPYPSLTGDIHAKSSVEKQ